MLRAYSVYHPQVLRDQSQRPSPWQGVPLLVGAREVISAFHAMIRNKAHADLDPMAGTSMRKSRRVLRQRRHQGQGRHHRRDHDVLFQRTDRGSDHQKLKLVKRQMYGSAKLDLLQG
jgi:hypothetical protein